MFDVFDGWKLLADFAGVVADDRGVVELEDPAHLPARCRRLVGLLVLAGRY